MRIVFMGTSDYATRILEKLIASDEIEVALLITQPNKPVGRKQILTPPHIKKWALNEKVELDIYQPTTLRNEEAFDKISSYNPDIILVAAYGQILPKDILDIAPCINLHASLLPRYRGASPIQTCILNHDRFAGITAMLMEEGLDSGDILAFRYMEVKNKRVDELFDELSNSAASLCVDVLKNFSRIKPIKQVNADATHCVKIKKDNGLFSFSQNAVTIYTKYKAYTPWPGIFLKDGLKIKEMELVNQDSKNDETGIIKEVQKDAIIVTCKESLLKIIKVQAPSKKEISAVEYVRGKRLSYGDKLV